MSNLSSVLKGEITRLARKEINASLAPIRKSNAAYRRQIAELKRQLESLQRETKAKNPSRGPRAETEQARTRRFTSKALKALRARLGLSAADFGRLVGASGQSIYNWESGKTVPRANQQASLAAVRGLGKREAASRLETGGK